jgi:prepilin-type N-terminal cleavage/methylation domain-containing protein/prepilin-type processing-associated H-X9-DG protein
MTARTTDKTGRSGGGASGLLHGFTLVELLVVVAIIALLIAILLPSLSSARRASDSVKCLSNLRQIGAGFQLYAHEHKGRWPVAVHMISGNPPYQPALQYERRWYDLIAKYVSGTKNMQTETDIALIRRNSVIWGCPQWGKSQEFDPNSVVDKLRVGYGMNYYPSYFDDFDGNKVAYIPSGRYYPLAVDYTRPSERLLIADAVAHILSLNYPGVLDTPAQRNTVVSMSMLRFQPYDPVAWNPPLFYIDAGRHAKPGTTKKLVINQKTINALFCDGHAQTISIREAFNAIRNPGRDTTRP